MRPLTVEINKLTSGDRGWRELLEALIALTDGEGKNNWLERKSQLEVGKVGAVKIATFIFRAANRHLETADRYLDDYAVIVLGVAHGAIPEISRVEDNDLENMLVPFLGSLAPRRAVPARRQVPGCVRIQMLICEPRPDKEAWIQSDWVITVVDPEVTTITAHWRATAERIDDAIEDKLAMPIETINLTAKSNAILFPEPAREDS